MSSVPTGSPSKGDKTIKVKWTEEERSIIVEHWVKQYPMQSKDFQELQALLPGRKLQEITDQHRRVVKPHILHCFQKELIVSAPSTPKKRSRKQEDNDF